MCRSYIFILLFSLVPPHLLKAQDSEKQVFYAKGNVIDDSTKKSIGLTHIFNESKRSGTISDEKGQFELYADLGDTLIFGALGYLGKVVIVSKNMLNRGIDVFLTPRLYQIDAVDIFAIGSYEEFKRKFLELEDHKSRTLDLRNQLYALSRKEAIIGIGEEEVRRAIIGQPGTEPINGIPLLSKEERQRINYARVLKLEEKERIVNKKYNFKIVKKVTGLPEDEILDFMSFCSFSMEYLLGATEYDIRIEIEEKLKEYLKKKPNGELLHENVLELVSYT